jgi:hypothetical protein
MGGTGVLEFCGRQNFQLLLSRRSPRILNGNFEHPTDDEWGFTLVRREDPAGNRRSSSYTFLAPVGADEVPQNGHVMTFSAETMPMFPEGAQPYARESEWGTFIKLFDYSLPGHRSQGCNGICKALPRIQHVPREGRVSKRMRIPKTAC